MADKFNDSSITEISYVHFTEHLTPGEFRDLCHNIGWFLTIGVLLLVLGALALGSTFSTTVVSIVSLGTLLIIGGLAQVIQAFRVKRWRGFFLLLSMGILSTAAGSLMVASPLESALSLTLLLAIFFIVAGLIRISIALSIDIDNWYWVLISGIIGVVLGGLVWAQWPTSSLWVIGAFIGLDLIFSGVSLIMLGLDLRKAPCRVYAKRTHHPAPPVPPLE